MRDLVYYIATTLDGFIAREDGSFTDFPWDEEFGADLLSTFPETFPTHLREGDMDRSENKRFDAVLMGRKTYEVGLREGVTNPYPTLDQYVFSHTLSKSPDTAVTLVSEDAVDTVASLKAEEGKAIWLCGGSDLATSLFEAHLVDKFIMKLNPIIFGRGIPLLQKSLRSEPLRFIGNRHFRSGHALLEYEVGG